MPAEWPGKAGSGARRPQTGTHAVPVERDATAELAEVLALADVPRAGDVAQILRALDDETRERIAALLRSRSS